jgi:2-polyprenyl-6-methoxyphenol hydroxylase-like FAD-dependent oxidoreductase
MQLIFFAFIAFSVVVVAVVSPLRMSAAALKTKPVIVVGAGPTGLATAIMLAKRGNSVQVFDKLPRPPAPDDLSIWTDLEVERSYNIGLSSRGQVALSALGVLDRIKKYTADSIGRKDWSPKNPDEPNVELYKGRTFPSRIIQRDRLTGALLEEIEENFKDSISIRFNTACIGASWVNPNQENEMCKLTLKDTTSAAPLVFYEDSSLVVGCDGTQSVIRDVMANTLPKSKFRICKLKDTNVRVYKTISLHFPPNDPKFRRDLNYSARLKAGYNLESLPTKEGTYLSVFIYRPNDKQVASITNKEVARSFFDKHFPMYKGCIRDKDFESFAAKNASYFPKFAYAGPDLHKGRTVCLLGDCIHSVKPFFGLGANSAFEDVVYLNTSLAAKRDLIPEALQEYSKTRGPDARAVVEIAKRLDGGFLFFVLPLLLDMSLHKLLPAVFSPNTLASLNNEKRSFAEIQRRKRIDRALQFVLGGVLVAGLRAVFLRILYFFRSSLVWM